MAQLDVLAVGDVVTDAFIKLFDDKAVTYTDESGVKTLAMEYGTKIPFDRSEVIEGVGNAANAAVSFTRLGLKAGFVTNVGEDKYGRGIIAALHQQKVDTSYVRVNPGKVSNYHYVLWYKEERTILINHEHYDYVWPNLRDKEEPRWIYFSSIAENALEMHDDLADWLDQHPNVKLAFQPGTFQMKAGAERLKRMYEHADILVLNKEEATLVGAAILITLMINLINCMRLVQKLFVLPTVLRAHLCPVPKKAASLCQSTLISLRHTSVPVPVMRLRLPLLQRLCAARAYSMHFVGVQSTQ